MDIQFLRQHLCHRKRDIEAELSRLSAIYNTKTITAPAKPPNPMNPPIVLTPEDRMKMLAMENERLRTMLKSLAKGSEDELSIINQIIASLGSANIADHSKWQSEMNVLKIHISELESELQVRISDYGKLTEMNDILNRHLTEKNTETSELQTKIMRLKSELNGPDKLSGRSKEDLDRLYRERLTFQAETIKSLEDEKTAFRLEIQHLQMKIAELNNSKWNAQTLDASDVIESQAFQKSSRIFEELTSIKSELVNFAKQQHPPHHIPEPSHRNGSVTYTKQASYYQEKARRFKRQNQELSDKLGAEKQRTESLELLTGQIRKEKAELVEKLAKCKTKLKQLAASPESRIIDSHIRQLEQRIAVRKEESDKLLMERKKLLEQLEEFKSQVNAKNSQIEQLNTTLLKFANNFKSENPPTIQSNPRLFSETPNGKTAQARANNYRSVCKNFAKIDETEEPDLHFDLSLNIPPDVEQFEHENLGHFNKLKNVVRDLNEKQYQHIKNLELKNEKIQDLKKASKKLKKDIEELQKENSNLKQSVIIAESKFMRQEEDVNRLHQEKKILRNEFDEAKDKLSKTEDKLERLNKLQRENKRIEKENEYFQKISDQKSVEIETLLRNIREKDELVRQVVAKSQHLQDSNPQDDQSIVLQENNKKLKKFLKRIQDDFFRLEEENNALREAVEREIELREQIVEEVSERTIAFEGKIELFEEFQKNLDDFTHYFSSLKKQ
jgi:chromosome segregation ATPase